MDHEVDRCDGPELRWSSQAGKEERRERNKTIVSQGDVECVLGEEYDLHQRTRPFPLAPAIVRTLRAHLILTLHTRPSSITGAPRSSDKSCCK